MLPLKVSKATVVFLRDLFSTATPSTPAFRPWPSPGSHRSRRPPDLRVLDIGSIEWLSPFIHGLLVAVAAGRSVCLQPINKLRACYPPTLRPKPCFGRCPSVMILEIARTFGNRLTPVLPRQLSPSERGEVGGGGEGKKGGREGGRGARLFLKS